MVATKKIDITKYVTKMSYWQKERQQQHLKSIKAEMQFARDRRHSAKTKKLKHTRYIIYILSVSCMLRCATRLFSSSSSAVLPILKVTRTSYDLLTNTPTKELH